LYCQNNYNLINQITNYCIKMNIHVCFVFIGHVSISPTFYKQLFQTNVFIKAGVNFTNVLCVQIPKVQKDSQDTSAKRHLWLDYLFALLGSVHVKAALKHVGEIDFRCQFHQRFMHKFFVQISPQSQNVNREKLPKRRSDVKFVRKMLMKLTSGLQNVLANVRAF